MRREKGTCWTVFAHSVVEWFQKNMAAAAPISELPFSAETLQSLKPTMSDLEIAGFVELCKRFLTERGKV
jgi:hypothetical protein